MERKLLRPTVVFHCASSGSGFQRVARCWEVRPNEIVAASAMEGISELGAGIRFGSCHVDGAQEYDASFVRQTDETLRQRVLVFDIWVRNTDRTFPRSYGAQGNPNLLWGASQAGLSVIDHNHAFLPDDLFQFTEYARHVFCEERQRLTAAFKAGMIESMAKAIDELDEIMAAIPVEWRTIDAEIDEPAVPNHNSSSC